MSKPKKEAQPAVVESEIPAAPKSLQKAFSIERCEGGWRMRTITLRDNQIEDMETTEPNLKIFAIEEFKKAAFRYWDKL